MAQINFTIFFIYILPILIGLMVGICLWKLKKTYYLSALMLFLDIVFWIILFNINTHGSEGPGMLVAMYTLATLTFTFIGIIKIIVRRNLK